MTATDPKAAAHLADLDDRFEGHLAALREHTERAKAALDDGTFALEAKVAPAGSAAPPLDGEFAAGPPDEPLIADSPLGGAVDDDGIPLWDDPT